MIYELYFQHSAVLVKERVNKCKNI